MSLMGRKKVRKLIERGRRKETIYFVIYLQRLKERRLYKTFEGHKNAALLTGAVHSQQQLIRSIAFSYLFAPCVCFQLKIEKEKVQSSDRGR